MDETRGMDETQVRRKDVGGILENLYYDPAHYAGYSSRNNLLRAAESSSIDRKQITRWLEGQDAYTLHKYARKKFPRMRYNVTNIDDVWEADLVDLRHLKSENDGFCYLLVVIDVLSKYAWVEAIRNKTCASVTKAFERILGRKEGGRAPVYLQTDKGKEFIGEEFQRFLKNRDIRYRIARNPDVKAAVVERFNRTLKERMWRYFTHRNTHRYVDVLQRVVSAYNHTRHSSTRMPPASVTLYNAREARDNIERRYATLKKTPKKKKQPKYAVGDHVRVSRAKGTFEKGYESNWTEEIFVIARVLAWRDPCVYELSDYSGETIDGIFYEQELARVEGASRSDREYIVDEILSTKGRGKNRKFFVSWRGYPSKFNSWIPAGDLREIGKADTSTGRKQK